MSVWTHGVTFNILSSIFPTFNAKGSNSILIILNLPLGNLRPRGFLKLVWKKDEEPLNNPINLERLASVSALQKTTVAAGSYCQSRSQLLETG